jgi:hypothetical protein
MNDHLRKMLTENTCLNCYYFRFAGLERWCSYPDHHTKIKNEFMCCGDWVDMFSREVSIERVSIHETLKKAGKNAD